MPARPTNRRAARWGCRRARASPSRAGGCDGGAGRDAVGGCRCDRRAAGGRRESRNALRRRFVTPASQRFAIGATLLRNALVSGSPTPLAFCAKSASALGLVLPQWIKSRLLDFWPDEPNSNAGFAEKLTGQRSHVASMQRSGIEGIGGSKNKCLDSVSPHRGYGCRASRWLTQGLRDMRE